MFNRYRKLQSATGEDERVAREIESSDKQIHRLVYELTQREMIYGLSEADVKVVEGKE